MDISDSIEEKEVKKIEELELDDEVSKKKKKKKKNLEQKELIDIEENTISNDDNNNNIDRDYNYSELLERISMFLRQNNPNLSVKTKYTLPPPSLIRVGTRKTMWANFQIICDKMKRPMEHVFSFFLAELGTEGSIDGNQRLVIRGRYNPKNIESLLKKYIGEYVTCHMCRHPETKLSRNSTTRLFFLECTTCGSTRSVAPIKAGFHATTTGERRTAKNN